MNLSVRFLAALLFASVVLLGSLAAAHAATPNVVIIFCDDLGYGDLACFGHPTIATPNLDRMAAEGQKWTNFYVAAPVCTPSRAAIQTGRLPIRTGMCSDTRRVLFPDSAGGLQPEEITIADALKTAGYATACIGKWHLGHLPQYLRHRTRIRFLLRHPLFQRHGSHRRISQGPCRLLEPQTRILQRPPSPR